MLDKIKLLVIIFLAGGLLGLGVLISCQKKPTAKYKPTWESLKKHEIPEWLRDGKFGIYTHWGVYSVHGMGPNGTWFAHAVYMEDDSWQRKHFEETYGKLTREFGYKDLVPLFKAEKFNADEWAELFQKAGAKFAGPVAEHHDGFAMWDTKYSEWNAAKMGPERDVVGELEKAIKKRGMKFLTAFHHAANCFYFPVWDERFDCNNPEYSGLYGPIRKEEDFLCLKPNIKPNKEFLEEWYGKAVEVVDKYEPDFVWFDFGLDFIREDYVKKFVTHYYNKALERNKEVIISYKDHDLAPGVGIVDLELGQMRELTHHEWITDTSVDDQGAWSYVKAAGFKTLDRLIDNLVDRVSKNGYLLLNVGPKPDGTIPEEAKKLLLGIGEWLEINGEAIYGTRAWVKDGEGPTTLEKTGAFVEAELKFTPEDIRFTVKDDTLYAIFLEWPGKEALIKSLVFHQEEDDEAEYPGYYIYPDEIKSITMLGDEKELKWELIPEKGLKIQCPAQKPCEHAYVFRIVRK